MNLMRRELKAPLKEHPPELWEDVLNLMRRELKAFRAT